jgi:tight adherence protein B
LVEILFISLVMIAIFAVILSVRAIRDRQTTADKRLVDGAPESGIGLESIVTMTPPPTGQRARFDTWFENAVRRSGLDASPSGVAAVMLLMSTAMATAVYFWRPQWGLMALAIVIGLAIPMTVVTIAHRRYRWRLQEQIPDAYRMLSGSIRAGLTLEQAIEFYSERGVKPLSEEFAHCSGLIRLGMSPFAALQSTAARIQLLDFDLLVSTVGLYTQTGGNLVLLLERLADSVRDRNQFVGQFFAATAQSRIVALCIGVTAPLILLVYILYQPEHVQTFFDSSTGWGILIGCGVLEVIGVLWLWRILKVDY